MPDSDGSPDYLDLYKLAVEMADRVSARRNAANSFFATLHAGLATILGLIESSVLPAIAGLVLAATWWTLLKSYRDLNRAKFAVILEMEENLPVAMYGREWNTLKEDPVKRWRSRFAELSTVERVVPVLFAQFTSSCWFEVFLERERLPSTPGSSHAHRHRMVLRLSSDWKESRVLSGPRLLRS